MYAYVKYQDEKKLQTVQLSKIKHFDPNEERSTKKLYKVQWEDGEYYDAIVLIVKNSLDELNKAIATSRPIIPPVKYLDAADTSTDIESENTSKKEMNENSKALLEKKLSAMRDVIKKNEHSSVNVPVKKRQQTKNFKKADSKLLKKNIKQERKDTRSKIKDYNQGKKDENKNIQMASTSGCNERKMIESEGKVSKSSTNNCDLGEAIKNNEKTLKLRTDRSNLDDEILQSQNTKKQLKVEIDRLKPMNRNKENMKETDKKVCKTRIIGDEVMNEQISLKTDKNKETLKREIQLLKSNKRKLEDTIEEQKMEIKRLKEMNWEFQDQVINGFRKIRDIISETWQREVLKMTQIEDPSILNPVGYRRKMDDTIHVGQDIWIPLKSYNYVVNKSKTKTQFVRNCAEAIFGEETLQTHTVSGTVCNADPAGNKEARPALDDTKMLALKDIYEHHLKTKFKASSSEIELELNRVETYVSKKICDLNRRPRNTKGKVKKNLKSKITKKNLKSNRADNRDSDSDDNDANPSVDNIDSDPDDNDEDLNPGGDSNSDDNNDDENRLVIDSDEEEGNNREDTEEEN